MGAGLYQLPQLQRKVETGVQEIEEAQAGAVFKGSWAIRYYMYRDTGRMIADRPLTGWGIGGWTDQWHKRGPALLADSNMPHNDFLWVGSQGGLPAGTGALALDTYELTKRFGDFTAMDRVTMRVEPGTVHALLGENGAGKSTLVKCVAGFQRAEEGSILIDGREQDIANPIVARALGIGMVYQHFTLAPGMTVAENLLLAGGKTPALIDWKRKRSELEAFLATTPFSLDLDVRPSELAAGEKQKLELLKQLYLKPRLLILDEPTSVLTPQEADEVLGHVREFARSGLCTVLIITHKFREVMEYADSVTVLRRGKAVHHCRVDQTSPAQLAQAMMGGEQIASSPAQGAADR